MTQDDVRVGQFVTVLEVKGEAAETCSVHGIMNISALNVRTRSELLMGHALQVMAVDLPFVALKDVGNPAVGSFDLRTLELTRLSDAYVGALHPETDPPVEKAGWFRRLFNR